MNLANQLLLATGLTLGVSLFLATSTKPSARNRSLLLSYFWGDQDLTAADATDLNLSTSFSLNGILYQAWLGYAIGPAALWLQAAWCFGFIVMALRAPSVKALANGGTLHAIIGNKFGSLAERFGAAATIIGFTLQIGWELAVFVSLFALIAPSASYTFRIGDSMRGSHCRRVYAVGRLKG